jgi:hypothetical protein
VRTMHRDDDHPRTDGPRPLFAVLAGALLALAGPALAGGGVDAHATVGADADVAVVSGGTELVGFGTITRGSLDLTLRSDLRGFVTLVVIDSAASGAVTEAFVTADGRVTVLDGTDFVALDRYLRPFGVVSIATTMVAEFAAADLASWATTLHALVDADGDRGRSSAALDLASQASGIDLHQLVGNPSAPAHGLPPALPPNARAPGAAAADDDVTERVRATVPVALRIGLETSP